MIDIKFDSKTLEISLKAAPKEVLAAARSAVRRAAQAGGTQLSKSIKAVSYLKGGDIKGALLKPTLRNIPGGLMAEVRVRGNAIPLEHYKVKPMRETARKGQQSRNWKSPTYQLGPAEPEYQLRRHGNVSAGFLARMRSGKLMFMQRHGKKLRRAYGVSPQYFAAFDATKQAVMRRVREVFPARLQHEIYRRLGKLA